eukprot:5566774-Pyramimonas_sp.AAC.1
MIVSRLPRARLPPRARSPPCLPQLAARTGAGSAAPCWRARANQPATDSSRRRLQKAPSNCRADSRTGN